MENNKFQQVYSKLVAKAWSDPEFKEKLLKNPESVLKDEGIDIPKGKKIKFLENTETQMYCVIPEKPSGNLTEKELESIAGGKTAASCGWNCRAI